MIMQYNDPGGRQPPLGRRVDCPNVPLSIRHVSELARLLHVSLSVKVGNYRASEERKDDPAPIIGFDYRGPDNSSLLVARFVVTAFLLGVDTERKVANDT